MRVELLQQGRLVVQWQWGTGRSTWTWGSLGSFDEKQDLSGLESREEKSEEVFQKNLKKDIQSLKYFWMFTMLFWMCFLNSYVLHQY